MAKLPGKPRNPPLSQTGSRLNRAARAFRSGFRRYPRAIYESIWMKNDSDPFPHLPEVLQQLWPHDLAVMWLGHASVMAQVHDLTIAVDPVLSDRIGMKIGRRTIGLPRIAPPPLPAEALSGSDLVLITHAHFDHLDRPTLQRMASRNTRVIVPTRCKRLIPPGFGEVIELAADRAIEFDGLTIQSISPAHWGARKIFDRRRGVNAYLIRSDTQCVFFAGDTAHTEAFDSLTGVDLAVFGIGAYDPWEHMHATPEQAWEMFDKIGARFLLPIHHSTFELSDEPTDEPMRRIRESAGDDFEARVIVPVLGEVVVVETAESDPVPVDNHTPGK